MKFNLIFTLVVAIAIASHVVVSAMKGKELRKLLQTKLHEVRQYAEKYMDIHGLPFSPNEEYP